MPKISDLSSYGQDASITGGEYLIGTDVGGATKTFTLASIAEYVESTLTVATGGLGETNQNIPAGATRTVDIGVAGSLTFQYNSSTRITLNSSATVFASGTQVQWLDAPTGNFDLANKDYVDGEIGTLASSKQNTLISGTNIKTVNGTTLLGSGNLVIPDDGLAAQNQVLTTDREIDLDTNDLTFKIGTGGRIFITPDSLGAASVQINEDGEVFFSNTGSTMAKVSGTATSGFDIVNYQTLDTLLFQKQATLVSGTNIKTINSTSILGSGNISVQSTLVSGTNIKTINGASILGSGDLTVSGSGGDLWSDAVDSDITPDTDNTYNLGSNLLRFGTVYSTSFNTVIATTPYLLLTPLSTPTNLSEGYMYYDSDDNKAKLHNGSSYNNILDATDILDDDTFATASATKIPTSESVKAYVDANSGSGANGYVDSTGNGLTGTQNGTNDVFTVSQSSYLAGSLLVFVSGFPLSAGNGLTETTPTSGVFTLDTPPESYDIIIVQYSN